MDSDIQEATGTVNEQIRFWRDAWEAPVPYGSIRPKSAHDNWQRWEHVRELLYELDRLREATGTKES